jgi:transposase-like protein
MSRQSKFTEEQIIRALKEVDARAKPADVCRQLGVSEQTFYRWKAKFRRWRLTPGNSSGLRRQCSH